MYFPRIWSHDSRANERAAPALHLLFGSTEEAFDLNDMVLLLSLVSFDCTKLRKHITDRVASVFRETPCGLLPLRFAVSAVLEGSTHVELGLFHLQEWESIGQSLSLLQAVAAALPPDRISIQCVSCRGRGLENKNGGRNTEDEETLELARRCFDWLRRSSGAAQLEALTDSSYPDLQPPDELLNALLHIKPVLYLGMFAPSPSLPDDEQKVAPASNSRLMQQRAGAEEAVLRRVGHCTTFSAHECGLRCHVLLWQRPIVEKLPVDMDNLDPGPLTPQPFAAELHIFTDKGEPLYLQERLRDLSSALDFCFEDYLHEDGELLLQIAPVEGVPFDLLDSSVIPFMRQHPDLFSPQPFLKGSCSGFIFPRVIRRTPSGKTAKLNPMTKTRAHINNSAPSEDDFNVAIRVLKMLSDHAREIKPCVPPSPECASAAQEALPAASLYTLDLPEITPLPKGGHECNWCQRRREKLLRCGACKSAFYCGTRHQAMDWKEGPHRGECKLWKMSRESCQSYLQPLIRSASLLEPWRAGRIGFSYAATAFEFLKHLRVFSVGDTAARVSRVHILFHDAPHVKEFAEGFHYFYMQSRIAMTHTTPQFRFLLVSKGFPEGERNCVYAMKKVGGTHTLLPSTGVLGDVWRERGETSVAPSPALFRVWNTPYHLVAFGSGVDAPHAILSFGPLSGAGLSYLSGAVEAIADSFAGAVPCRWVESSLVGAVRTQRALLERIGNSLKCASLVKEKTQALPLWQVKEGITLPVERNDAGVATLYSSCESADAAPAVDAGDPPTALQDSYVNSDYFDFPLFL